MASLPLTQSMDLSDALSGDEELNNVNKSQAWGRLFPLSSSFVAFDLLSNNYTFGRGMDCDVCFSDSAENNLRYDAYSKIHFKLSRIDTSTGTHVFLEDTSSNGTFVNGQKVGKGKKYVLKNNDEIALAVKQNKAYVFMDINVHKSNLPSELTQKYILTSILGRGTCGEVRLAFAKGSCEKYACKIISKKTFSGGGKMYIDHESRVMSEVKILKALKHPCIISIVDVVDTADMLYIVLELVEGGELFDKIVSIGKYDEATAKLLFFQIATAVKYLHDEGITHRDLKPENILLSSNDQETLIKVTDFGLSKFVDAGSMLKTFCGTPTYVAPEILLTAGSGTYTEAIDCWSLGVILFIMLSGYSPFADERTDMDLPQQIVGGHYTFPKQYWKDVSATAVDLIKQMLNVDPSKRITTADILNHPWLLDKEMRKRANAIMYGDSDSTGPLKLSMVKRKAAGGCDEPLLKRKPPLDTEAENNQ